MHKYDTFEDIEHLHSGLLGILKDPPSFFEKPMIKEFRDLLNFCKKVIKEGEESEHFMHASPFDLVKTPDSQGRAVTIDPDHASDVKNSIVRAQKVYVAGLVKECSGGNKKEIVNCNHRVEKSGEAIKDKLLPNNFKMPIVCVPYSLSKTVDRALDEIQDVLNSGMPKKLNNSNDMVTSMMKSVYNHQIDLNEKEQYDDFVSYFGKKYPQCSLKTIKGNATRVKNKKNFEGCDVWCDSTVKFTNEFVSVHAARTPGKSDYFSFNKAGQNYKNCKLEVVSTKGSSYDQLFRRDLNFNFENPDKRILHLLVCQVNKGDPQTTLQSRKTYFTHLYKDWFRVGRHVPTSIGPELVVVVPQNMGSVETSIYVDSEPIVTSKEIKEIESHWKLITREEIHKHFQSPNFNPAEPYKLEWIVTEAAKAPSLSVVAK